MSDINLGCAVDGGYVMAPVRHFNRHGVIAGATGTGKTVTVESIIEQLSRCGVPSLVADVKGDLSGIAAPSSHATMGVGRSPSWWPESNDVELWDCYGGGRGRAMSVGVATMGPQAMAHALELSDAQAGVLEIAFAFADWQSMHLHSLQDVRDVMAAMLNDRDTVGARFGHVSKASVGTINRALLRLANAGGDRFFGPSDFELDDIIATTPCGRGIVNILDGVELIRNPRLYGAVMMLILDMLARELPEVGDVERPVFALVIDEAHALFRNANPALIEKIDMTARLIRSKGVGLFFASQAASDIPESILAMMHLRIQHTLNATTPGQRRAVASAADSFPASDDCRPSEYISNMPRGQALVSYMGEDGKLTPVQRVDMAPPRCRLGPLTDEERRAIVGDCPDEDMPGSLAVDPVDVRPAPVEHSNRLTWPQRRRLVAVLFAMTALVLSTVGACLASLSGDWMAAGLAGGVAWFALRQVVRTMASLSESMGVE